MRAQKPTRRVPSTRTGLSSCRHRPWEDDADYAVSFACPADNPGVFYIYGQASDTVSSVDRLMLAMRFGGQEALMVFDDVSSLGQSLHV